MIISFINTIVEFERKKILCVCIASALCISLATNAFASGQDYENSGTADTTDYSTFEPGSKGAIGIDLKTGVETQIPPEDLIKKAKQYEKNLLSSGSSNEESNNLARSTPTGKYKGIVIIEADTPGDKEIWSTGFMVGPTGVATCAHGLYNKNGDGWYQNIRIYTLADNGNYGQKIYASFATIGGNYKADDNDDWGVLELPYEPENYYYFGLEAHNTSNDVLNESVTALGYTTGNETASDMSEFYQTSVSGEVLGISSRSLLPLATNCEMVHGMSGGPLLRSNNNAIAINVTMYNNYAVHMLINDWLLGALLSHSGR